MKWQPELASLMTNQLFEGFVLVRQALKRVSSTKKEYLDLTVCDLSGDVNGKMWDNIPKDVPEGGQAIYVRGKMEEFNGRKQLRVNAMRPVTEKDELDMSLLVPCAPEPAEDMKAYIDSCVEKINDADIRRLVRARVALAGDKLMYWPAASKLHHAEKSGLLHHTVTMLRGAQLMCTLYDFLDKDLVVAGVVLHDMSKITELDSDRLGSVSDYTAEGMLLGHLVKGITVLDKLGRELDIPEEKLLLLEHMILSHHDLPEYGSPKPPMIPEAELLHALDELDARMFEMDRELKNVKPGSFTDRLWSLDRKLYRRAGRPAQEYEPDEEKTGETGSETAPAAAGIPVNAPAGNKNDEEEIVELPF